MDNLNVETNQGKKDIAKHILTAVSASSTEMLIATKADEAVEMYIFQKTELDIILKSPCYNWAISDDKVFPITMCIVNLIDGLYDGRTMRILDEQIHYSKKIIPIAHMLRFLLIKKELYSCSIKDADWESKKTETDMLYKLYGVLDVEYIPIESYSKILPFINSSINKTIELFSRYKDEVNRGLEKDGEIK